MQLKNFLTTYLTLVFLLCFQSVYAQKVELRVNAYEEINWSTIHHYKANLHTHTRVSDGDLRPHEVVDRYHQAGYHILSITDHIPSWDGNNPENILTWPWTGFSGLTAAVRHDATWQDRDPEALGMLAIQGSEQSEGHHRGSYFTDLSDPGGNLDASFQAITDMGGLAILFHPGQYWNISNVYNPGQTFSPEWYQDFFDRYEALVGLEVYNQGNKHPNDRVLWDEILTSMMPDRPVWGYSGDDMHFANQLFKNYQYMLMDSLDEEELRTAMTKGQLFFSFEAAGTGNALVPRVDSLSVNEEGEYIEIHGSDYDTIEWISGISGQGSDRMSRVVSTGETFYWGDFFEPYVRAVLINGEGRTYTQPFGFSVRTIHVSKNGNDDNNGLSWETAFASLDKAVEMAFEGDMIWVAGGTYRPNTDHLGNTELTDSRERSFQLVKNLVIYGGFAGYETELDQRDFRMNETILSGALDDGTHVYHVIFNPEGMEGTSEVYLDGFTISGGRADGNYPHNSGGGMYNAAGSPTLRNVIFSDNEAVNGGALYNTNQSQTELIAVLFKENHAVHGGAIFNNESATSITHSLFSDNHAEKGGVMYSKDSNPVIKTTVIRNNTSVKGGFQYNVSSSPELVHLSISGNSASNSGSLFYNTEGSNPQVKNSILWGNEDDKASAVFNESLSVPVFQYSIVEGSGGSLDWSAGLGADDGNNLDADPMFLGYGDHPLMIYGVSPAVGTGNNSFSLSSTDIRISARPAVSLSGSPTADMGAYEFQPGEDMYSKLPVFVHSDNGSDVNNGASWESPFKTLERGLQAAGRHDTIWVAAGTYYPMREVGGSGNPYRTFQMKNHVAIYGGFAGFEDNLGKRDITNNKTILNGEVGRREHVFNVFFHSEDLKLDSTAVLDGFIIQGGIAGGNHPRNIGGGMLNVGSSPTILNTTFQENSAEMGGGMFNDKASTPIISNVTFIQNEATHGAGLYNNDHSASVMVNTSFIANEAGIEGGAVFNNRSSPVLINVLISGNAAYEGGGIANYLNSEPVLINCTLSGNLAYIRGGAMFNSWEAHPKIRNSIIWGNIAGGTGNSGNQITNDVRSHASLYHTIYSNDLNDVSEGGGFFVNEFSLASDPMFLEPVDALNAPSRGGDLRLQFESPAIDAGDNAAMPHYIDTDLTGHPRIIDGNDDGDEIIDLGAFEYVAEREPTSADKVTQDDLLPREFRLQQNYPNPFNPVTVIGFQIPKESHVVVEVVDILGRRVVLLVDDLMPAGEYKSNFDASHLSSGVYLYRIITADFIQTRKMMLIK